MSKEMEIMFNKAERVALSLPSNGGLLSKLEAENNGWADAGFGRITIKAPEEYKPLEPTRGRYELIKDYIIDKAKRIIDYFSLK